MQPLHILLAEDDECTRLVVKQLLKRNGYTVTTAKDGQEALNTLHAGKGVDLILTDVVMPQVSGIQLTNAIGQTPDLQHLPVVVMSSEAQSDLVQEAFAVGAADFLVKPIRKNEVATLWQHVWRSMQALAGTGGAGKASGCVGMTFGGWPGASKPSSDAPAVAIKIGAQLAEEDVVDVSSQQAAATPGSCPVMPQHASITAAMQPAWPATSPAKAQVRVGKDDLVTTGSLEAEGSDSGVSGGFNLRAAMPHYAGLVEGTREAPPDYGGDRCSGPTYAALPRIVSAPCLLSMSMAGSSQQAASGMKRARGRMEASGSAERHHKKRHAAGAVFPSTSNDSGDSAETIQLEQSSAAPSATAAGADGSAPGLDISRCASLSVCACILMPVDLEIAPLDLGSSGSGTFCWQGASELAMHRKTSFTMQPEPSACTVVNGNSGKKGKAEEGGPTKGTCNAKGQQHRVVGGRMQKDSTDNQVAHGDTATWAANRKAALQKLREKKKLRSFQKKVRYESRRKLAESRPRVRGQFVKAAAAPQS